MNIEENIIGNRTFEKINFSEEKILKGEYNECEFIDCNFSEINLSNFAFIECKFKNCNFSMAKIKNTALKDVKFINSKLLGLNFSECDNFLLTLHFELCQLKLASFYKLNLKNTEFKNCNLQEVDFTEADLTSSTFEDCDLTRAIFVNTILEKTDFTTSNNYSFDPEINRIKKAKFSKLEVIGLLDKYDISIK